MESVVIADVFENGAMAKTGSRNGRLKICFALLMMSLEVLIFLGIAFNVLVALLSKFKHYTIGIDSLPAISIIAGYLYGTSAAIFAALIVSVAYYAVRLKNIQYAPVTVLANVLVGALAAYMQFAGLFVAGMLLLVVYHALSGVVVAVFGGLKPGYFSFLIFNIVTTIAFLYVAAGLA